MQTIFKWDSLPLTQLSSSTARGQFEQIVIDSHLTERPPFQWMAQSQSRSRSTCSWAHSVLYVLQLKIYWSIVNIIKYIFQVLSLPCQLLASHSSSSSGYGSNFIAQMDSKDRFNAIYSRCLTLNDRLPASYSSLWYVTFTRSLNCGTAGDESRSQHQLYGRRGELGVANRTWQGSARGLVTNNKRNFNYSAFVACPEPRSATTPGETPNDETKARIVLSGNLKKHLALLLANS